MDYEKLHKDTITKLQEMVNSGKITVETARGICADFIPESEDERIRKELLEHCVNRRDGKQVCVDASDYRRWADWLFIQGVENIPNVKSDKEINNEIIQFLQLPHPQFIGKRHQEEWIAWLEKQSVPTEDELEALRIAAYEPTKNWSEKLQSLYEKLIHYEQGEQKSEEVDNLHNYLYGEQKPVDNIEPKFKVGDIIKPKDPVLGEPRIIKGIYPKFGYDTNNGILDFEFEDNWELVEKPAWSEEDERIYKVILELMDSYSKGTIGGCIISPNTDRYVKWFKSLKARYTWKPSDEQMAQLKKYCPDNRPLTSLYEQLKKLKEE